LIVGGAKGGAAPAKDAPIDIGRVSFKVGKIVQVERHPQADHLYVEQVLLPLLLSSFSLIFPVRESFSLSCFYCHMFCLLSALRFLRLPTLFISLFP